MLIKMDMEKVYDQIEWDFLLKVLSNFTFVTTTWINWVMECVSTASMTILLNNKACDRFLPERGLIKEIFSPP